MENKENNVVEAKKTSTKVIKYAAIAAAAVGLGYILGNKETRTKIGASINKLTAQEGVKLNADDLAYEELKQEEEHPERPRKEWRNKGWRQERQFNQQSN